MNPQAARTPWPIRMRYPAQTWLRVLLVAGFLLLCLAVFVFVEGPIRAGTLQLRLGADTVTYWEITELFRSDPGNSGLTFISFSSNLIGPLALALVLRYPALVMFANIAALLWTVQLLKPTGVSRTIFLLLLALNATTLVSLVTLNKEIFALVATLLLCRYVSIPKPSKWLLFLLLAIGMLARWQQPALTLLFLFFRRKNSYFRRSPWAAVGAVVLVLTIAYPVVTKLGLVDLAFAEAFAQGGGTVAVANTMQSNFLFPVAAIIKIIQLLTFRTFTLSYWINTYPSEDFTDLANQFVIHLHALAMIALSIAAYLRGRLRMERPMILFAVLYLVVTSANLFIQPRYEYPVYAVLCFELAMPGTVISPLFRRINVMRWMSSPLWGRRHELTP